MMRNSAVKTLPVSIGGIRASGSEPGDTDGRTGSPRQDLLAVRGLLVGSQVDDGGKTKTANDMFKSLIDDEVILLHHQFRYFDQLVLK
jgi:hypothetical protein